jgi:hypothetical protein
MSWQGASFSLWPRSAAAKSVRSAVITARLTVFGSCTISRISVLGHSRSVQPGTGPAVLPCDAFQRTGRSRSVSGEWQESFSDRRWCKYTFLFFVILQCNPRSASFQVCASAWGGARRLAGSQAHLRLSTRFARLILFFPVSLSCLRFSGQSAHRGARDHRVARRLCSPGYPCSSFSEA